MLISESRFSKNYFVVQKIFRNFDYKNRCKNEFEDHNEKLCNRSRKKNFPKNRFYSRLKSLVPADGVRTKCSMYIFSCDRCLFRFESIPTSILKIEFRAVGTHESHPTAWS